MDKTIGTMLGLAIGDALGTPVAGMKDGHIRQVFGEVSDYVDSAAAFPDRPGRWHLPGLYGAAAQQALAVADVLAIYGELDRKALADLYLRLADEGPAEEKFGAHRATTSGFRRALQAMRDADDPRCCGQPTPLNDAAPRGAAAGLFFPADEDAMVSATIDVSLMTHSDPRAVAAALVVARVVAQCAAADDPDAAEIAEDLPEWVRAQEVTLADEYGDFLDPHIHGDRLYQFSNALKPLASLLRESNDDLAAKTIVAYANECGPVDDADPDAKVRDPHHPFVLASVPMVIYRALAAPDFLNGMTATINAGGDAASVGAIAGAILGARFGDKAIPGHWIDGLVNADQVAARGGALRDHEVDWSVWEDTVEMEKSLTARHADAFAAARRANRKPLEKAAERSAVKKQRQADRADKRAAADPGFAPPPEVWLRGGTPSEGGETPLREDVDPIEAKKERARRGRKRIDWKDDRRRGNKSRGLAEENQDDEHAD